MLVVGGWNGLLTWRTLPGGELVAERQLSKSLVAAAAFSPDAGTLPLDPPPEPAKPEPEASHVKVGDLVDAGPGASPPQLVSVPKPGYPPMARNLRVEGTVVVSVLVDENGQVQDVKIAEPIKQNVGLNEAALSAARSAHYKPATKDGVRVKMWTRLRIPFKL